MMHKLCRSVEDEVGISFPSVGSERPLNHFVILVDQGSFQLLEIGLFHSKDKWLTLCGAHALRLQWLFRTTCRNLQSEQTCEQGPMLLDRKVAC